MDHWTLAALEPRRLFAAGDPLESFGRHGTALTPYELYYAELSDVKPTPGGKLLASVASQTFRDTRPGVKADFVRFNADGSPDLTFGSNGSADSFFGTVRRVTVRSDGKFYALGSDRTSPVRVNGGDNWFVARFHADGRLDRSFGVRGRIALRLPRSLNEGEYDLGSGNRTSFLDTDGRLTILAAYKPTATSATSEPGVFRFDASGFLDRSFNDGQPLRLRTPVQRFISPALAVSPGGEVAIAAERIFRQRHTAVLLKLDAAGRNDASFGDDGIVTLPTLPLGSVQAAFAPDGRLFTGGVQYRNAAGEYVYITRVYKLHADGSPDTTFDGGGLSYSGVSGPLVPTNDGGVVIGSFDLQRFRADGSRDEAFGTVDAGTNMNVAVGDAVYGVRRSADYALNDRGRPVYRFGVSAISLANSGRSPVTVSNGVATFTGTGADDGMDVQYWNATTVNPNARLEFRLGFWSRTLPLGAISKVVMNGDGGGDDLRVFKDEAPDLVVVINGGSGNDYAAGYGTNISFYGGPGDDNVYGDAVLKD